MGDRGPSPLPASGDSRNGDHPWASDEGPSIVAVVVRRLKRSAAFYLAAFFLAAAAAPHHHLDPIADLLSDGPSNSGTFAQITGVPGFDTGIFPGSLVQDESCLACFNRDFIASPAVAIALTQTLAPLPHRPVAPPLAIPSAPPAETPSRAPPTFA
jgi:hypothetical protein